MIDAKKAVEAATSFAEYINDDQKLEALRVEEVELSDDGTTWLVKLGWNDPQLLGGAQPTSARLTEKTGQLPRIYKIFHVDAESGAVKKMKKDD